MRVGACLLVRAEVAEGDREAFDRWYESEHLPDAVKAFGALGARRGWSDVTPGVHLAIYDFPDLARAREAVASAGMTAMIAEFDRTWADRVRRTREIVELVQML